ncbi:MAG: hypothetical protein PHN54_02705 [Bacilli bacterium]|nr:hypothetical protein [Bacilli bacterium]
MTVYGIYFFGIFVMILNKTKNQHSSMQRILILSLTIVVAIFIYINVPILQVHVENLFELKPSSATTRIVGSFEYALEAPFWGVGAGNEINYFLANKDILGLEYYSLSGVVNNILAVIILYNGYIGLLIILAYLFIRYSKHCLNFLFVICVSFFAWGYFNTSGFFITLMLLEVYYMQKSLESSYEIKEFNLIYIDYT